MAEIPMGFSFQDFSAGIVISASISIIALKRLQRHCQWIYSFLRAPDVTVFKNIY